MTAVNWWLSLVNTHNCAGQISAGQYMTNYCEWADLLYYWNYRKHEYSIHIIYHTLPYNTMPHHNLEQSIYELANFKIILVVFAFPADPFLTFGTKHNFKYLSRTKYLTRTKYLSTTKKKV